MHYAHLRVADTNRFRAAGDLWTWSRAIALAGLLILALMGAPAWAGGGWQVVEVDGKVHIRYGAGRWVQAQNGDTLFSTAEIITGADGRVVLARGPSTIAVAPGGRIELPQGPEEGPLLQKASLPGPDHQPQPAIERVFQTFGTLLYKVKPDSGRQFQVQTPYLVTTIKGTVFTVAVNTTGAAVHVTEGLVEVMPVLGGIGAMVAAGQAAVVPATAGADVKVRGRDAERAPKVYPDGRPAEKAGPAETGEDKAQSAARGDEKSKSKKSVVFVNAKGVDEYGVAHLAPAIARGEAAPGQADLNLGQTPAANGTGGSSPGLRIDSLLDSAVGGGSSGGVDGGGGAGGENLAGSVEALSDGGGLNLGGVGDGLGDVAGGVGEVVDGVGDLASDGTVDLGGVGDGLGGVVDGLGGVVDGVGDLASSGPLDLGGVGDGLDGALDGVGGIVDGVGDLASDGSIDLGGVSEGVGDVTEGVGSIVDGVGDIVTGGGGDSGSGGGGLTGTLQGLTGGLLN